MFNIFKRGNKCAGCGMKVSSDAIKRGGKLFCCDNCVERSENQSNDKAKEQSKGGCCE